MALPVTITGLATATPPVGPYKSSAGNYYLFAVDGTTATTLQAYKATAPDVSWSSVTTKTGFTTGIKWLSAYQVADVIHICITDGLNVSSINTKYVQFNMAADTFGSVENIVLTINSATSGGAGAFCSAIVVRSTGNVVVAFQDSQVSTRSSLSYSIRTAVNTWSAKTALSAAAASCNYVRVRAALGASDIIHFNYAFESSSFFFRRTLSAANALNTEATIAGLSTSGFTLMNGIISFTDGTATRRVIELVNDASSGTIRAYRYSSVANPSASSSTVVTSSNPGSIRVFFDTDGSSIYRVYLVYLDASGGAGLLSTFSADNGSTWSTPVAVTNGSSLTGLFAAQDCFTIFQRGSSWVIPYVSDFGSNFVYTESIVRPIFYSMTADTGSFALSGNNVGIVHGYSLTAVRQTFALTGFAASLTRFRGVVGVKATFSLTGRVSGLLVSRRMPATSGVFVLNGIDAALVYASTAARVMAATPVSFALHGINANLVFQRKVAMTAGTFTLNGWPVLFRRTFRQDLIAAASPGIFNYTVNGVNLYRSAVQPGELHFGFRVTIPNRW